MNPIKDFSKDHNLISILNPTSILNMALLSIRLMEAHKAPLQPDPVRYKLLAPGFHNGTLTGPAGVVKTFIEYGIYVLEI